MTTSAASAALARRVYPFEPYYDHQSSRGFNLLAWPPRLEWSNDGTLRLAPLTPEQETTLDEVYVVETIWEHPRCPFVVLCTSWAVYVVTREHFEAAADHRDSADAAVPPASATTSAAEAWQALPADVQDRVGGRMAEHAQQLVPNSELARLAERPEIAALLDAGSEHTAATQASQPMDSSIQVLLDLSTLVGQINERRANKGGAEDAVNAADKMMFACEVAGIDIPDDPRWRAGAFWRETIDEQRNVLGWLLCLQAVADRPDLCAAVVRRVVTNLEKGLLTDHAFAWNEV